MATLWLLSGCGKPQAETDYTFVLPAAEAIPQFSLSLSARQAYQAIPHQRTEFPKDYLRVPETEKRSAQGIEQYAVLIKCVAAMEPPPTLQTYHQAVALALQAQQSFFKD